MLMGYLKGVKEENENEETSSAVHLPQCLEF